MFRKKHVSGGVQTSSTQDVGPLEINEREQLRVVLTDLSDLSKLIHQRAEIALLALQQKSKGEIL